MTDIEQALAELEDATREWKFAVSTADEQRAIGRLETTYDNLAALRAKEARENALYAHQWGEDEEPGPVVPLSFIRSIIENRSGELYALHPFDKAESKYTGEVITGNALTDLLTGEP